MLADTSGNTVPADTMELTFEDAGGNPVNLDPPDVLPFPTYSYTAFEVDCTPYDCSQVYCGDEELAVVDTYDCLKDGVQVDSTECAVFLGPVPDTTTVCCPAADPDTCLPKPVVPTVEPTPVPTAQDCYGTWEAWSSCSESCGAGYKHRRYHVINEGEPGGQPCDKSEYSAFCWASPCPVDCEGSWMPWSACLATCTKEREFSVEVLGAHGGLACPEPECPEMQPDCKEKDMIRKQTMKCDKGACIDAKLATKEARKALRKAEKKAARAAAKEDSKKARKEEWMEAKKIAAESGEAPCSKWCGKYAGVGGTWDKVCEWSKCGGCDECKGRRLFHV